jgi:hypothetical protein
MDGPWNASEFTLKRLARVECFYLFLLLWADLGTPRQPKRGLFGTQNQLRGSHKLCFPNQILGQLTFSGHNMELPYFVQQV